MSHPFFDLLQQTNEANCVCDGANKPSDGSGGAKMMMLACLRMIFSSIATDGCIYISITNIKGVLTLKTYIEERAVEVANFIINYKATVRETAKKFGVSKSTIHTEVTK